MAMMRFDTLKLSKHLAEAGMDSRQAEVLAQSFADIIAGQFASKQDLKNAFAEQDKKLEARFAAKEDLQDGLAALSELMKAGFAEMEERLHRQLKQSQMVLPAIMLAIMLAALGLATTLILMN